MQQIDATFGNLEAGTDCLPTIMHKEMLKGALSLW